MYSENVYRIIYKLIIYIIIIKFDKQQNKIKN